MPIETLPLVDIRTVAKNNPEFTWPHRARRNRLEPVCRPRFDPSFALQPGERVFTIGSCFANNIAGRMKHAEFEIFPEGVQESIPAKFRVNNLDFHYTPYSILQTFQWALEPEAIRPRSDCYIETEDGEVFDPTLDHKTSGTRAEVDAINQLYTEHDGEVRNCRVVVITLGLVECIFDQQTGLYLESWPGKFVKPEDHERYQIHVMDGAEIRAGLEDTHALLSRHLPADFKIILTVSPVPLANTFRDCDVIAANTYSKSSLRAAAEEFAGRHDNVDYLPVYESVMLSDRLTAWNVDLRHPSEFIVRLNVLRMINHYVDKAEDDEWAADADLIEAEIRDFERQFEEDWPEQVRAFRGQFAGQEARFEEHMAKSEALRQAMEDNIRGLNQTIKSLQDSNTQYLAQLVEKSGQG